MRTPNITNQMYPALIAALNMVNFPIKPAVGGIPASEKRNIDIASARKDESCPILCSRRVNIGLAFTTYHSDDSECSKIREDVGQQVVQDP